MVKSVFTGLQSMWLVVISVPFDRLVLLTRSVYDFFFSKLCSVFFRPVFIYAVAEPPFPHTFFFFLSSRSGSCGRLTSSVLIRSFPSVSFSLLFRHVFFSFPPAPRWELLNWPVCPLGRCFGPRFSPFYLKAQLPLRDILSLC